MIFDLKSGKRRLVVQVVFGFLAFVFAISFIGFGVGSGGIGGLFDAIGLGGSSNSSDPQFDSQISDAQDAIKANPKDGNAYADLIAAYYGSAQQGISRDQQTGQVSIESGAQSDLNQAGQAWADYLKTKPNPVNPNAAASAVQVFVLLNDAAGAAQAQQVLADKQRTSAAYAQLALYLFAGGNLKEGDAAGQKAVDAASPAQQKQVQKTIDGYHQQAVKYQKQLAQQRQQQGGQAAQQAGQQQLENPFGALGGSSGAGSTPVTPTP